MGMNCRRDSADQMLANATTGAATLEMLAKRISRSLIKHEPISSNYVVGDVIGRGKFAVVKRVTHRTSGQVFAAKFIRRRRKGADCLDEILQEIAMLELARAHRRLIGLVEAYETLHEVVVVTEYAAGGELFQLCGGLDDQFTEQDSANIVCQILEGLHFLHGQNIVHLDIKPQNILLTESYPKGEVKVCDFTSSRIVGANEELKIIFGTPDYVAPEVLQYEPVGTATDMWSLGVLVYVLLTGHSPFGSDDKQETFLNITEVNVTFPEELFAGVSDSAQNFIRACLSRDPSDRPTAAECLDHPWLRGQHAAMAAAAAADPGGRTPSDHRHLGISSTAGITVTTVDASERSARSPPSGTAAAAAASAAAAAIAALHDAPPPPAGGGSSPQKWHRGYGGGSGGGSGPACGLDRDGAAAGSKLLTASAVMAVQVSAAAAAELLCN